MTRLYAATALVVALSAAPIAQARDIQLPLNDQQQVELFQLLDLATKAGGFSQLPSGRAAAQAAVDYASMISNLAKATAPDAPPPAQATAPGPEQKAPPPR